MHETPQGNHYQNWMFRARAEVNMSNDYSARWRYRGNRRVPIKPSSTALLSRAGSISSLSCVIFGIRFPNNPNVSWKWLAKCDKQRIICSLLCLWFRWTESPFLSQISTLLAHALLCSVQPGHSSNLKSVYGEEGKVLCFEENKISPAYSYHPKILPAQSIERAQGWWVLFILFYHERMPC